MSPQARVVAEAVPHHVTQRLNNRQDLFLTDDDRRFCPALHHLDVIFVALRVDVGGGIPEPLNRRTMPPTERVFKN